MIVFLLDDNWTVGWVEECVSESTHSNAIFLCSIFFRGEDLDVWRGLNNPKALGKIWKTTFREAFDSTAPSFGEKIILRYISQTMTYSDLHYEIFDTTMKHCRDAKKTFLFASLFFCDIFLRCNRLMTLLGALPSKTKS